jgi:hypothetical protein
VLAILFLLLAALLNYSFIPIIFCLVLLIFLLFGLDVKILDFFALVALAWCVVLFLLRTENAANQALIYFYYLVSMIVILKILEFNHPDKAEKSKIGQEMLTMPAENQGSLLNWLKKRTDLLVMALNIFAVIVYLLIFGTNLPNGQNYFQFIGLVIILLTANLVTVMLTKKTTLKIILSNRLSRLFEHKNAMYLVLINASISGAYMLIFGFNLPNLSNPIRFWLLICALAITNIVALIDVAND